MRVIVRRHHVNFRRRNPAAHHLPHFQPRAHIQRGRSLLKKRKGNTGIHKSPKKHVAADSRKTLKVSNTH
jgi:hypothetical protein